MTRGTGAAVQVVPPSLEELRRRRGELVAIAARHGASNIRVFGSVALGQERAGSDVDLLVDLEPDRSLLDLGGLLMDLQDALGCAVDVGEADALPEAHAHMLAEAVPL